MDPNTVIRLSDNIKVKDIIDNDKYDNFVYTKHNDKQLIVKSDNFHGNIRITNQDLIVLTIIGKKEKDVYFDNVKVEYLELGGNFKLHNFDDVKVKSVWTNGNVQINNPKKIIFEDELGKRMYFYENIGLDIEHIRNELNELTKHRDNNIKSSAEELLKLSDDELISKLSIELEDNEIKHKIFYIKGEEHNDKKYVNAFIMKMITKKYEEQLFSITVDN